MNGTTTTIQEQVVQQLIGKGYHISFAESCTGGLAAAALVSVADASKVLDISFVTYANEAKTKYLGVKEATIETYGVVSEEVAYQMAEGVAKEAGSEIGVGITGVAGPSGGTGQKPVGMVCFGFYICGQVYTDTQLFGNPGRNEVRRSSVEHVYERLQQLLYQCH
ncbi:MAG: CinA family protein [Lachnospiraceae bacterium]|nr:CinA family protein [Lachnospiraceae bacterium]